MSSDSSHKEKVVITGGAGFIGSNVADHLLVEGYAVHIVDDLSSGKIENISDDVQLHKIDIIELNRLRDVCEGARFIFHLAANPRVQDSIDDPIRVTGVNVIGTLNVLTAARDAGVERVIFASSASVYGDGTRMPLCEDMRTEPISPYGLNKLEGEQWCRMWSLLYQVPTVALRFFNVYGPRFDPYGAYPLVVGYFLERQKKGLPLTITGDGSNTRDYVHVHDVARANYMAAVSDQVGQGEVINIGSGIETSVLDIARLIGGPIEYVEPRIEPKRSLASIERAKNVLGWEPTISLEDGIAELKKG